MYLTLKQQVKHLNKKEFRNLKYLCHIAKNLLNNARTLATLVVRPVLMNMNCTKILVSI